MTQGRQVLILVTSGVVLTVVLGLSGLAEAAVALRWSCRSTERSTGSPILAGRVLVTGSRQRLRAFDVRSGRELWTQPLPSPYYLGAWERESESLCILLGLPRRSEEIRSHEDPGIVWHCDADPEGEPRLLALTSTGDKKWERSLPSYGSAINLLSRGRILVWCEEDLLCMEPGSGRALWTYHEPRGSLQACTVTGNSVLVVARGFPTVEQPNGAATLVCLNGGSGKVLWRRDGNDSEWFRYAFDIVTDGRWIYVGDRHTAIHRLDLKSGRTTRTFLTLGTNPYPHARIDGVLVYSSETTSGERCAAIDTTSGGAVWRIPIEGHLWRVVGPELFLSQPHVLLRVEPHSGRVTGKVHVPGSPDGARLVGSSLCMWEGRRLEAIEVSSGARLGTWEADAPIVRVHALGLYGDALVVTDDGLSLVRAASNVAGDTGADTGHR